MPEKERVLAVNEAFYAALRAGDFVAMDRLWSQRKSVAVYHPRWRGIDGREAVMESWYKIMTIGVPPPVYPQQPTVVLALASAMIICEEKIDDARLIATNVFVKERGGWRMTHHQASPLPIAARRRFGGRSQSTGKT